MPGLQPVSGGPPPCSVCGRPAQGQCARCHAWLCADCAELVPGLSRPLAVCPACSARPLPAGRRLLRWLLWPAVVLLAVAGLVVLLRLA